MAVQKINNALLYGLAADTKPTTYANNTLFFVQDTGDIYRWNLGTTTWVLLLGASKTETLTNKTIAAGSNTITGIGDSNIATHTTTKISTTSKSLLNTAIVYNDQTNTYGAFAQIFPTSQLKIQNPAATFNYIVAAGAITADRTISLPVLSGGDTFDFQANTATLTNKTINATNNTITDTSTAAGDILKSDGSKFTRLARGSSNQVLAVNGGGTDIAWTTLAGGFTEAKGSTTKSGDASTLTFTQAHGLGGTPTFYTVTPTSTDADADFYLTIDSTNITINYPFAPPSGTSNLTYVWRAAL